MINESKTVWIKARELNTPYVIYNRAKYNVTIKSRWIFGPSVNAKKALSVEETEGYLAKYLNLSPLNADFQKQVEAFWENIYIEITDVGYKLEVGWRYADKEAQKKAGAGAENEKHKYGIPINIKDYVIYRLALVKGNVARDVTLVEKSPKIKYYLVDKDEDEKRKEAMFKLANKATTKYMEIVADTIVANQVCLMAGIDIAIQSDIDALMELKEFATNSPDTFLSIVNDKLLTEKCVIKSSLSAANCPIQVLTPSNAIIYNGEIIANNIEELAKAFNAKQHIALYNELVVINKDKQASK